MERLWKVVKLKGRREILWGKQWGLLAADAGLQCRFRGGRESSSLFSLVSLSSLICDFKLVCE